MKFQIAARQPFNFVSVVQSHGWFQLQPFHYDESSRVFSTPLGLSGGRVIDLHLSGLETGLQVETDPLDTTEKNEVIITLRWMFSLDEDLLSFYEAIQGEPALAHVKARSMGRILRSATLFEDVIRTILTTNTLWAATKRMTANLVDQFGQPWPGDGSRKAFPTPDRLAKASEAQLRSETRLGYRAPYVLNLARSLVSGQLDLESLKTISLPTVELRKELLRLQGVGPYAAANLLMLLGRFDFVPVDSWAFKMVSHEWYDDQPVTTAQVEAVFEKWGEWKGLVYFCWDWSLQ